MVARTVPRFSDDDPPKRGWEKNRHMGVTQVFEPTGRSRINTMKNCPNYDLTKASVTSTTTRTVVDVSKPLPT
jgi:hypothetical protein